MERSHIFIVGICLLGVASVQGCSFFSLKPDAAESGSNQPFRAVASSSDNLVAVPIEIADDISKINTGQTPRKPASLPAKASPLPKLDDDVTEPTEVHAEEEQANDDPPDSEAEDKSDSQADGKGRGKPHPGGHNEKYVVKRGDTLMKIAFAKFGNLYRWKEIYDLNRSHISGLTKLVIGSTLKIDGVEYVVIEKNGEPYLIKRNDTLVKISQGVYGHPHGWKDIWHNNPKLIHDPNKIYAGFTLYYKPASSSPEIREPASGP